MATIPRYQTMGIQYADLPRLSTAGLEQAAKGYDVLADKLDRMSSYFQDRAVTEAQKEAKKYSIENPLTKEQVDVALGTKDGLKVAGAGSVFQETYEKMQGKMLSTELQLQGNRKMASVFAAIESGAPVNLVGIETELKDMIDGYTASVMALDPDQALQMKASLSTVGNTLYQKAAAQAIKQSKLQNEALFETALSDLPPVFEAIFGATSSIDPSTGKPINIDSIIETQRRPFLDSVALTGETKYLKEFDKQVREAKVGALTARMVDRTWAKDSVEAIKLMNEGNFGNLTSVYAGLSQEEKDKIRTNVMKSYSDEYTAGQQAKTQQEEENKQAVAALTIEFINPNTSPERKRQLVNEMVLKGTSATTAKALLKPPTESDSTRRNPELFSQLNHQINIGVVSTIEQLVGHRNSLSDAEFRTLGTSVSTVQGRTAVSTIKRFAGVSDNPFIPASASAKAKEQTLFTSYDTKKVEKITDKATGVERYMTPVEAANAAIEEFNSGKNAEELKIQERMESDIKDILKESGASFNGPDLYLLNVESVKGLSSKDKEIVKSKLRTFKSSVDKMGGK